MSTDVGKFAKFSVGNLDNLKNKEKKEKKGVICNQIFEDCKRFIIEDPYWVSILDNFARGKYTKGFTYRNNTLISKKTSSYEEEAIPDEPGMACQIIIRFLKKHSMMKSCLDKQNEQEYLKKNLPRVIPLSQLKWEDIKLKSLRDIYLDKYIDNLTCVFNLDDEKTRQLRDVINFGINRNISNSNIIFQNGEITKIDNLIFNETTKKFEIKTGIKKVESSNINDDEFLKSETNIVRKNRSINFQQLTSKYFASFNSISRESRESLLTSTENSSTA